MNRIALAAVVLALVASSSRAEQLNILLVDPGHTETGEFVAATLKFTPGVALQRVDLPALRKAKLTGRNAVIWINPEPQLYINNDSGLWGAIAANKSLGLMVIGLPHDVDGRAAMFQALARRGNPKAGARLGKHLDNADWIWTEEKAKDNQTLFFRKTFTMKTPPPRTFIQASADNKSRIILNGAEVGHADNWKQPDSFDVTKLIRAGQNIVAVEVHNEDGPAGLILDVIGSSEAGKYVPEIATNPTWKYLDSKAPESWTAPDFDDSKWKSAKTVAKYGGGYWQEKVRSSFGSDEYVLTASQSHPATAGIANPLGRAVVLSGLAAGDGCEPIIEALKIPVALAGQGPAGRLVLCSAEPEKASIAGDIPNALSSNAFADFVLQSVTWLASGDDDQAAHLDDFHFPESTPGKQPLKLAGKLAPARSLQAELIVRDQKTFDFRQNRKTAADGTFAFEIPVPASWQAAGPLRASLVIRDANRIVCARAGEIAIADPIKFELTSATGRWTFSSGEKFDVKLNAGSYTKPSNVAIQMRVTSANGGVVRAPTPGKPDEKGLTYTVDTQDLAAGGYVVAARYVSASDYTLIAQRQFPFVICDPPDKQPVVEVAMEFSSIPYQGAILAQSFPDSRPALHRMVDDLIDHGMTTLVCPLPLPNDLTIEVESYAQSRGMRIMYWFERGVEQFDRMKVPTTSTYAPQYKENVEKRVKGMFDVLARFPRLTCAMVYGDEPFHQGLTLFLNGPEEKAEFKKRFGYDLPTDIPATYKDPKKFADLIEFRTSFWPDVWNQIGPLFTSTATTRPFPRPFLTILNHDSHNTFGGGVGQENKLAIDDVFHWGADFVDLISFDIYPYLMSDFRYGPNRALKLPRQSQTHYAFAHMRNLAESFGKKLGFWYGTYNPEWYDLDEDMRQQYWEEREMCYTALAAGTDFLLGGLNVPIDAHHWNDLGASMKPITRVSAQLLAAKKPRSRAAMLFPRTQYVQLQEEYFNVAQSFEAFLRAFGELDIIHEDQIAKDALKDYQLLVLFDVKLLPQDVAQRIDDFARSGGVVIADCVPNLDPSRKAAHPLDNLFGVRDSKTNRILWPYEHRKPPPATHPAPLGPPAKKMPATSAAFPTTMPVVWGMHEPGPVPPATSRPADLVRASALGIDVELPIVSPRACVIAGAETLLSSESGQPILIKNSHGKGKAYLLCFCLQDTSFETWRRDNPEARKQLNALLNAITTDAGVRAHARSENPDIEASIRVGHDEAFLFVIAHEPAEPDTRIWLRDLSFKIGKVIDVDTDQEVPFTRDGDAIHLETTAPTGVTRLMYLTP